MPTGGVDEGKALTREWFRSLREAAKQVCPKGRLTEEEKEAIERQEGNGVGWDGRRVRAFAVNVPILRLDLWTPRRMVDALLVSGIAQGRFWAASGHTDYGREFGLAFWDESYPRHARMFLTGWETRVPYDTLMLNLKGVGF